MNKRFISIRACPFPELEVALFHSRKKLLHCLNRRGIQVELTDNEAQTFCQSVDGANIHFVLIEHSGKLWDDLALLAHESVHIAMRYFELIGEEEPAEEEICYITQAAAGCLFEAHLKWMEGKK